MSGPKVFADGKVKAWVHGVALEEAAMEQLLQSSRLPFLHHWIAAMPDVHWGRGATIGSVIPLKGAIVPAAVGVDIGCGMMAVKTSLRASDLPSDLRGIRAQIERDVPHGKSFGRYDRGSHSREIPKEVMNTWMELKPGFERILECHPDAVREANTYRHLGTLGGGNHFLEICLDENQDVWVMLHSGSRGVGNRIGTYFIEKAREAMQKKGLETPNRELAWFEEGSQMFEDYWHALSWGQEFARRNREIMMSRTLDALRRSQGIPPFEARLEAVNCHHNYASREVHFGEEVYVTRKGAVRAGEGELGIIPGSMGAKSFIVRGRGNPDSFHSCSHGAGRAMSRKKAREHFGLEDHLKATEGVECRKDLGVIDETPGAYKPIEKVMQAQSDLVETVHTLKQVLCVKG